MVYKVKKDTIRKYYKVSTTTQTWTQPPMSANGSLGGDIFAVSSTNDSDNAYHAFDSTGVKIDSGTLTLYNPNSFCITKLVFAGKSSPANAYVKAFTIYGSNDNSSWIEIQSFSGGTVSSKTYNITNSSYHKYYKMVVTDGTGRAYICNLTITATEQVTVMTESTASDYDIYKDVLEYSALKESVRKYYKYVAWTQPTLSSDTSYGTISSSITTWGDGQTWHISDGVKGTSNKWGGGSGSGNITWHLPEKIKINSFQIWQTNESEYLNRFPKTIKLYASDDGTNYTEVGSLSGYSQPASAGYVTVTCNTSKVYEYYKWEFGTSWKGSEIAVSEIVITAQKVIAGTTSDYDYYEDVDIYKALEQ